MAINWKDLTKFQREAVVLKFARFSSLQNELAMHAIQLGLDRNTYLASTHDAFTQAETIVSQSIEAVDLGITVDSISNIIKSTGDNDN